MTAASATGSGVRLERRSTARHLRLLSLCAFIGLAAACSDDTPDATSSTTTASSVVAETAGVADEPTDTTAPETPTTQPLQPGIDVAPTGCKNLDPCAATMRRPESLAGGDVVSVRIEGWNPEQWIGIAQCADRDAYEDGTITLEAGSGLTSAEFCNVKDIGGPAARTKSDAAGAVAFEYEVVAGQQMADQSDAAVSCDADHACVLNVFVMNDGRFNPNNPSVTFPLSFS